MAEDDIGDGLWNNAQGRQRVKDQLAVGHHSRVDDDHGLTVTNERHRSCDSFVGIALDNDVDGGAHEDEYMSSRMSEYMFSTTRRFIFWLGVSSPVSTVKS